MTTMSTFNVVKCSLAEGLAHQVKGGRVGLKGTSRSAMGSGS